MVDKGSLSESVQKNPEQLKELADALSSGSRRERQNAAAELALVAKADPEKLVECIPELVDALNRPEARTRWECLDALTILVEYDSRACDKALIGAESSLFDEDSGPVRLAAMRFLCKLGSTTNIRSEKTWPLIDEGIQCYHGDLEFNDMLTAISEFSEGKISEDVKAALVERMRFDAENGKGSIKRRAAQIVSGIVGS